MMLKNFLPKIHYIKEFKVKHYSSWFLYMIHHNSRVLGMCKHNPKTKETHIYILKGSQQKRTLIHELCHWIISICGNISILHELLDKTHQPKT